MTKKVKIQTMIIDFQPSTYLYNFPNNILIKNISFNSNVFLRSNLDLHQLLSDTKLTSNVFMRLFEGVCCMDWYLLGLAGLRFSVRVRLQTVY